MFRSRTIDTLFSVVTLSTDMLDPDIPRRNPSVPDMIPAVDTGSDIDYPRQYQLHCPSPSFFLRPFPL